MSDTSSLISEERSSRSSSDSDPDFDIYSEASPVHEFRQGVTMGIEMTDNEAILADKLVSIVLGNPLLEKMIDSMKLTIKRLKKPQYVYPVGFLLGFLMNSGYDFTTVIQIKDEIVNNSSDVEISDADIIRYFRLLSK